MGEQLLPSGSRGRIRVALLGLLVAGLTGCDDVRRVAGGLLDSRTPRQRYVDALGAAGLASTALATDWASAGERALREAPLISSPHEELGYLAPGEPVAIAFRVRARRGQEVSLEVDLPGDTTTTIFLDAWMIEGDSASTPASHIASADSALRVLRVSPRRDGDVVLRIQPELLRGGRFRATLRVAPTLAFPVRQGTERDIGSRFGAPRDAGARSHHGIDIFAQRGTPVLAAAAGVVHRANETPIGGRVVWLRDVHGNSLYYAHLDRQAVTVGMHVGIGDTIGFVGNTGNARTTPPHLHFGVYRRGEGPVDPYWFVYRPRGAIPRHVADTGRVGSWIRPNTARAWLRSGPGSGSDTVRVLQRHSALRVLSVAGEFYRVRLPDGVTGLVAARATEPAERALATLPAAGTILARPTMNHNPADVMEITVPGDSLDVLGRFGDFVLVRSSSGLAGWLIQH